MNVEDSKVARLADHGFATRFLGDGSITNSSIASLPVTSAENPTNETP
jgi:hypothetical protein